MKKIELLQAIVNVLAGPSTPGWWLDRVSFKPGDLTHPALDGPHNMQAMFGTVASVAADSIKVTLDLNQHKNPLYVLGNPWPTVATWVPVHNVGPTGIALLTIDL